MYELPTSISLKNGNQYKIQNDGDYRMVLDCLEALEDQNLKPLERLYSGLMTFYEDFDDLDDILSCPDLEDLISEMFNFFNLNEPEERSDKPKLVDWKQDANLIVSAINNVAGKEIRAEQYIHWWTFIGYYMAIGECSLATVIGIRNKIARNEKLEKYEKKFRAENPKYFTIDLRSAEQKANDAWARSIWNSGGE